MLIRGQKEGQGPSQQAHTSHEGQVPWHASTGHLLWQGWATGSLGSPGACSGRHTVGYVATYCLVGSAKVSQGLLALVERGERGKELKSFLKMAPGCGWRQRGEVLDDPVES